jgi:type IV secretory pathway TrbL component
MDERLKDILMPLSIIGSFGAAVYYFVKVMTDYILKKKMIEKGFVNDDTQAIFKQQTGIDNKYSSLKWGLIVLSGGLALVILEFIDVRPDSPLPYGLLAVFISLGFLAYYFIVQKKSN